MNRCEFIRAAGVGAMSLCLDAGRSMARAGGSSKRPNFVFILIDDPVAEKIPITVLCGTQRKQER